MTAATAAVSHTIYDITENYGQMQLMASKHQNLDVSVTIGVVDCKFNLKPYATSKHHNDYSYSYS